MKCFIIIIIFLISDLTYTETILNDSQSYKPGEKKVFSLDWSKALQLCIKIPNTNRKILKKQCSKPGGCLNVSDKTNSRSYGYNRHIITVDYDEIKGGKLDFVVSNRFDVPHNIDVIAFNPNYQIDETFDLPASKSKEFKASSTKPLAIFASIQVDNSNPLDEACSPKSSCLKVEYYDSSFKSWLWVASNSGVGKTLPPDENGEIKFRVVNAYPMSINVRVTASDIKPKTCEW